jgi:RNA methyltransferase, TrmH family
VTELGTRNSLIQDLRRLSRRRSSRSASGRFVVDGPMLVTAAIEAGVPLEAVFLDGSGAGPAVAAADRAAAAAVPVHRVGPGVLASATDPVTTQGIAAVARRPAATMAEALSAGTGAAPLVLVLAGVADPGNAGTLLRSAEAAGATAVVAVAGTVDLFGPKTVRSSAGALFHVPVVDEVAPQDALSALRAAGLQVWGTAAGDGTPYDRADLTAPTAVVLGNEAHGVGPPWIDEVDRWLTIPMVGRAESLNVAMAGTLVCFEAARQRRCAE